jgi:hypothetical protein
MVEGIVCCHNDRGMLDMRTRLALVFTLVYLMLAACGDDGGGPTTGATTSITTGSQATTTETQPMTTTEPSPTTTTLGTTTLAEGTVHFSGEGAFASEPFSLPGAGSSIRYIVEATAGHIGDGSCAMVVRIEKGSAFGSEDVYWWLAYSTADNPGIASDAQELSDVLPSDEFRLVTEPTEPSSEYVDYCSWEVTLRPA